MITASVPLIVPLILEAALRALFAAVAVWAALRLLRVDNVLMQKTAWGLVLVAAFVMPLMPRWQAVPALASFRLPALPLHAAPAIRPSAPTSAAPTVALNFSSRASSSIDRPLLTARRQVHQAAKVEPPQTLPPAPDRYPAPSISSSDFDLQAKPGPDPVAYASPVTASADSAGAPSKPSPIRMATIAWLLYLGVFAALLLRLLVGLVSALRLWVTANPVAPLIDGENDGIQLRSSDRVASPVNIGSGIVLPSDFADWDEEKMRVVLAHERSHVRQGDFYLQLLAGLYAAFFWFSPLGWWLKRKLSELGEAISDRAGLEEAASRSSYAQLLLEFAALPRPTLTGVAMARNSHLTQRIERLLNESSFRRAFAAGGRRALLAVFLVPVALFAATALVRVEAAVAPAPQNHQDQLTGQSAPQQVADPAPPLTPAQAPEAPAPPTSGQMPEPSAVPAPPPTDAINPHPAPMPPDPIIVAVPPMPRGPGEMAPMPPMPLIHVQIPADAIRLQAEALRLQIDPTIRAEIAEAREEARQYLHDADNGRGEPYALVGDPDARPRFNSDWNSDRGAEIEKARKVAHGHFLWFRHNDKSYIVDDPAIVAQVEAMNKSMDELGGKMRALGEQMRELGKQQREIGKQMHDVTVPTPDLSKEMAELNAAVESLKAKQGGTINQKDLGDLQREMGRIQGELGALQGKIMTQQLSLNGGMGKFGEQQSKLGGQMGELGAQMGQMAKENRSKIQSIIDESLKNGKARPVE